MAACPHKRENGPPISSTKLGQRIARLLLFASVGGGKDEAPAGSYKLARSVSAPVASVPVHERTLWFSLFYTSNKQGIYGPSQLLTFARMRSRPSARTRLVPARKR